MMSIIKVRSNMMENPSLHLRSQQTTQTGTARLVTAVANHPIVNRLPPISQGRLKAIGATRGKTVAVDQLGQVMELSSTAANSSTHDAIHRPIAKEKKIDSPQAHPRGNINTASIWARMPSEDSEDEETSAAHQQPESSASASTPAFQHAGFTVVKADPRYIVNIDTQEPVAVKTTTKGQMSDAATNSITEVSNNLERTGVIAGSVLSRISKFDKVDAASDVYERSADSSPDNQRKVPANNGELHLDEYDDDFEEDDDNLLAQYAATMKGNLFNF